MFEDPPRAATRCDFPFVCLSSHAGLAFLTLFSLTFSFVPGRCAGNTYDRMFCCSFLLGKKKRKNTSVHQKLTSREKHVTDFFFFNFSFIFDFFFFFFFATRFEGGKEEKEDTRWEKEKLLQLGGCRERTT